MFGFEQCCDADGYQAIGAACLANWHHCWDTLRPIGAIFLSAFFGDGFPYISRKNFAFKYYRQWSCLSVLI